MGLATALIVSASVSAIGGAVGANQAKKAAGRASRNADNAAEAMKIAKASRATIINPYSGTKDLSGMAKNLSGKMFNPFASLGVATQAAEMQVEEADIALANTLDTLRATGASAGGATALAQAALQSKKGVSASIESQEAANEKMRAQAESQLNKMKVSEEQRIQGIAINEGQRVQAADAQGKAFEFQAQEKRTNMDMNRAAGQMDNAQQQLADAKAAEAGAWGGAISAVGGLAGSTISAYGASGAKNADGSSMGFGSWLTK